MTILGIVSYYIDISEGCLTHTDHIMIAHYESLFTASTVCVCVHTAHKIVQHDLSELIWFTTTHYALGESLDQGLITREFPFP